VRELRRHHNLGIIENHWNVVVIGAVFAPVSAHLSVCQYQPRRPARLIAIVGHRGVGLSKPVCFLPEGWILGEVG